MSKGLAELQRLLEQEFLAAEEQLKRDDERMFRTLRGEPFWGADKPAVREGDLVGLADFVPKDPK